MSTIQLETSSITQEEVYPYETDDFYECWWRHFAPMYDVVYQQENVLIQRKKILKGFVSVKEARIAGWNQALSQDLTVERVKALEALQKKCGWDYFRIIWNEKRQSRQQFELLQKVGYQVLETDFQSLYAVDITNGFEQYLKTLSHGGRRDLKKRLRLGQVLNPQLVAITQKSEIEPFFEEFFSFHIPYWRQKMGQSYFDDPAERNFVMDWAKKLYDKGTLRLDRLILNGKTANLSMAMISKPYAYFWITINTGLYSEYVPGILGLAMRVQEMANLGVQYCNLGAGDYPYKIQSSNQIETCKGAFVFNPRSLKAKLCHQWLVSQYGKLNDKLKN